MYLQRAALGAGNPGRGEAGAHEGPLLSGHGGAHGRLVGECGGHFASAVQPRTNGMHCGFS